MDEVEHHVITLKEVQLKIYRPFSSGGCIIPLQVGKDDATDELLSILRSWVNHRFALVLRRIDDDERPALQQKRRTGTSDSTVGNTSASDGDPARTPRDKIVALAGMARRLKDFQGWCLDTYGNGNSSLSDPQARFNFAKECIYKRCRVTSNKQLLTGTPEGEDFLAMYDEFKNEFVVPGGIT